MTPLRSFRRRLAGFAVLGGWVLGVLVLPALHLAFHEVPHDHAGGGIHFHAAAGTGASRHVHPHRAVDAAALRRASGQALRTPVSAGLELRNADFSRSTHDADGLAHFGSAPGEGAYAGGILSAKRFPSPHRDVLSNRHAVFFLVGKRAPRAPPAG
jgi:hypothetical protein